MKPAVAAAVSFVALTALFLLPIRRTTVPLGHWERSDFDKVFPGLQMKVGTYSSQLLKKNIIGKKRILMKHWKSNVRKSLFGNMKFGKTETGIVVVGYLQDGDASVIFPGPDSEHFITEDNIEEFKSWLAKKIKKDKLPTGTRASRSDSTEGRRTWHSN